MSLLTSAIPLPYRILAGVLIVGGLFVGGYLYGYHNAHLACQVAAQKTVIVADQKENQLEQFNVVQVTKLVPIEVQKVTIIHDTTQQLQTQAVQDKSDTCQLSDQFTQIYNAAIAAGQEK